MVCSHTPWYQVTDQTVFKSSVPQQENNTSLAAPRPRTQLNVQPVLQYVDTQGSPSASYESLQGQHQTGGLPNGGYHHGDDYRYDGNQREVNHYQNANQGFDRPSGQGRAQIPPAGPLVWPGQPDYVQPPPDSVDPASFYRYVAPGTAASTVTSPVAPPATLSHRRNASAPLAQRDPQAGLSSPVRQSPARVHADPVASAPGGSTSWNPAAPEFAPGRRSGHHRYASQGQNGRDGSNGGQN